MRPSTQCRFFIKIRCFIWERIKRTICRPLSRMSCLLKQRIGMLWLYQYSVEYCFEMYCVFNMYRLRASLGLAPLRVEEAPAAGKGDTQEVVDEKGPGASDAVVGLSHRVSEARRGRLLKEKTLGEEGEDVDDVMQWVEKTRATKPPAGPRAKKRPRGGTVDDEDALDLKNAKVKGHSLEALDEEGEMILTLADRGILNEAGTDVEDEDELVLENVRERENMERERAIRASTKAKPLWEEDGVKRSMLDKYDEEEEEAFVLGDARGLDGSQRSRKGEDMKSKLAAAQESLLAHPLKNIGGDYYTAEELEKAKKPKKKRKERKLKKKALTADDLEELERAAREENGENGHLATREDRQDRLKKSMEAEAKEAAEKRSKFDAALAKANIASSNLRMDNPDFEAGEDDREDEELAASLARARDLALKKNKEHNLTSVDDVAQTAIRRRQQMEAASRETMDHSPGLTFTNIGEFARSVALQDEANKIKEEPEEGVTWDDMETRDAVKVEEKQDVKEHRKGRYRTHKVEDDEALVDTAAVKTEDAEGAITVDKTIGVGLGSALSYLKERGELHKPVDWAGRTNDSRDPFFTKAMGGYKDVYSGGRAEDEIAANVEVALTRKDEYGRILTPKEAFRNLCHSFHGIQPSQNTKEKRMRQAAKEIAQKRAATGTRESGIVSNLQAVQAKSATPFMVLSGTVKPGQTRDAGIPRK